MSEKQVIKKARQPKPHRCPLNRFRKCLGPACGMSIRVDGKPMCSVTFISLELNALVGAMLPQQQPKLQKTPERGKVAPLKKEQA